MSRLICDVCLTPFSAFDCYPDCTPAGQDWSELCPTHRERRLKYWLEELETETEEYRPAPREHDDDDTSFFRDRRSQVEIDQERRHTNYMKRIGSFSK